MFIDNTQRPPVPKEKLEFATDKERVKEKPFERKSEGYFKDAFFRFCKNKASIVASLIILFIVLFSVFTPMLNGKYEGFLDPYYAKKGPRNLFLSKIGVANGEISRDFNERGFIQALALGIGADGYEGETPSLENVTKKYNPIRKIKSIKSNGITRKTTYTANIDSYLEVGFLYRAIEQTEFDAIRAWEGKTGLHVLYPLIEENDYCADNTNANYWYKANAKLTPLDGQDREIAYSATMQLVDNYKRDSKGSLIYRVYTGGGNEQTAQFKVRVLYYNYYVYQNGFEPAYIFGTDSQGYDLALRLAVGIRLSLLVALFVSAINFLIGTLYGTTEGYFGGKIDIVMERISEILNGIPFIVVATLFQLHFAKKVGAIPSLLFAFVVTGWIGTAGSVRAQFYRFKGQEYVMASRMLGASNGRIIWKHIFPNALGTIITSSALVIPSVIFSESMLSFLGIVNLGGSSMTSLGQLLSDASGIWTNYPHLMIFPAVVISLLMICFNLFGNGLRDAFNPSLRGVEE